jgi:RNA polymerase sigma-70 factor (ECF subfamily)
MSESPVHEPSRSISTALLDRVRAGDPPAWERLVRLYGPIIYEWARKAGLEPNSAADVVQETFRSVLGRVADFRRSGAGESFQGWLWTITHNKLRDRARRQKAQGRGVGGTSANQRMAEIADPAEASELSAAAEFNVARRALELVRGEFEERTWRAFWLTVVEDRRPDLVAAELGMSLGSIYTAKCRVLKRLRDELAGDFADRPTRD